MAKGKKEGVRVFSFPHEILGVAIFEAAFMAGSYGMGLSDAAIINEMMIFAAGDTAIGGGLFFRTLIKTYIFEREINK